MGLSRDENVDNRKHGPATTKADASIVAMWPASMGDWDAPGQRTVTAPAPDGPRKTDR